MEVDSVPVAVELVRIGLERVSLETVTGNVAYDSRRMEEGVRNDTDVRDMEDGLTKTVKTPGQKVMRWQKEEEEEGTLNLWGKLGRWRKESGR